MPGEEASVNVREALYPELDPKGGPGAKFPLPSLIKALLEDARGQAAKFQIKDPYILVRPDANHTILSPPPGCTAFYYKAMELGLRFPLTQFEKDLLNAYNLCLGQLSPNSWGGILAVQVICDIIGVKPTLTLWRHMYKLFEMPAGDHGPGWWCFQARRGYRTVLDLPTSQKGFRRGFAFVYFGGEWGIPTVPPSSEPNHCLNFKVPELSDEEAVAAIYFQLEAKIVDGGEVFVAGNWLPSCKLFKNEHFLAAFGLSPAFPKEASLAYIKETDQEMAERLTSAALKAARIRAEMKANKINKPSKPKDPSNPKPRKRKERAEERVEMTEKALAKARAEEEAAAKKARKDPSIEVNSPRPDSGGGGTHVSVHPSDFEPVRSPGYEPGASHHSPTERSLSEAPVPFTQMSKTDKKKRISDALEILCTQTDRDHINEVNPRNESSELFRSWMDFSIRMTKVAEDRLALVQEVSDLKQAARSHFDEVYQAKEAKRLAELRLEEANKKIDEGEAAWNKEKKDWQIERTNLSLAKENAESAKATARAKSTAQSSREGFGGGPAQTFNSRGSTERSPSGCFSLSGGVVPSLAEVG
ncbi:uncharacterized protein LOC109136040 [Beta vulgaris subsp. vulgaris]|uniref:uncharacterized protein LOC109136040 n=1 Tax=Beta vulgaris subsp. vulgaris TaxID=3555 RepID=UPI002547DF34|nr:uncharacterized protein LOC109136040 [Beta vulgaris subsp. vulgaris]